MSYTGFHRICESNLIFTFSINFDFLLLISLIVFNLRYHSESKSFVDLKYHIVLSQSIDGRCFLRSGAAFLFAYSKDGIFGTE